MLFKKIADKLNIHWQVLLTLKSWSNVQIYSFVIESQKTTFEIDTGSKCCMICHIESLPSSSTSFREINKHIFIANIVLIFLMYVKFDTEKINTPKVVQKI